jgi:D-glucuronyl C5-epimerase C-terminus
LKGKPLASKAKRASRCGVACLVVVAVLCALSGAILTHYLELAELSYAKRFRTLVYGARPWEEFDDLVRSGDAEGLAAMPDTVVTHPMRAWLAARHETWCVLSRELQAPPLGHLLHNLPACPETINEAHLLGIADWFIATGEPLHAAGVDALMFPQEFSDPYYFMPPPRYGAMTQSRAGQVLLAAHFLTSDKKYLDAAILATNALRIPIAQGGTAIYLDDGGVWFEKVTSPNFSGPTPRVLNGHIFAMDVLYWLRQLDPKWDVLYEQAHRAVENHINEYVAFGWSYYDLYQTYAHGFYHNVHILQLRQLNEIFGQTPNITTAAAKMQRDVIIPIGIFERLIFQSNRMIWFLWAVNTGMSLAVALTVYLIVRYVRRSSPQ